MPKKTKETAPTGPGQGAIARLIGESYDVFVNEVFAELLSKTDLGREKLLEIRPHVLQVKDRMKNNTVDSLIKMY